MEREDNDMQLTLVKGRPATNDRRLEKEIRTYDVLDSLGIEYERVDHEEANTMEACLAIDEVLAPAVICKNLFLCNAQKTKFYLLMIREVVGCLIHCCSAPVQFLLTDNPNVS